MHSSDIIDSIKQSFSVITMGTNLQRLFGGLWVTVWIALVSVAFSMILETKPDIVLLDLVMPKCDGFGVLDRVKKTMAIEEQPTMIVFQVNTVLWLYYFSLHITD